MSQETELAIKIDNRWVGVDWHVFRSWTGPRMLDGAPFHGVRFELGTDITARSVTADICDCCSREFQYWPQSAVDVPLICPECNANIKAAQ